jgi:hypothetical protein
MTAFDLRPNADCRRESEDGQCDAEYTYKSINSRNGENVNYQLKVSNDLHQQWHHPSLPCQRRRGYRHLANAMVCAFLSRACQHKANRAGNQVHNFIGVSLLLASVKNEDSTFHFASSRSFVNVCAKRALLSDDILFALITWWSISEIAIGISLADSLSSAISESM